MMLRCCVVLLAFLDVFLLWIVFVFFFFKQKTAYEMRISDWSSDVCSSDLQSELIGSVTKCGQCDHAKKQYLHNDFRHTNALSCTSQQIGRASCRERVCQYV